MARRKAEDIVAASKVHPMEGAKKRKEMMSQMSPRTKRLLDPDNQTVDPEDYITPGGKEFNIHLPCRIDQSMSRMLDVVIQSRVFTVSTKSDIVRSALTLWLELVMPVLKDKRFDKDYQLLQQNIDLAEMNHQRNNVERLVKPIAHACLGLMKNGDFDGAVEYFGEGLALVESSYGFKEELRVAAVRRLKTWPNLVAVVRAYELGEEAEAERAKPRLVKKKK